MSKHPQYDIDHQRSKASDLESRISELYNRRDSLDSYECEMDDDELSVSNMIDAIDMEISELENRFWDVEARISYLKTFESEESDEVAHPGCAAGVDCSECKFFGSCSG